MARAWIPSPYHPTACGGIPPPSTHPFNITKYLARPRRPAKINQGQLGLVPAVAQNGPLDLHRRARGGRPLLLLLLRGVVVEGLHHHEGDLEEPVQAAVLAIEPVHTVFIISMEFRGPGDPVRRKIQQKESTSTNLYMLPETSKTKSIRRLAFPPPSGLPGGRWGKKGSSAASARRRKTSRSPAMPSTVWYAVLVFVSVVAFERIVVGAAMRCTPCVHAQVTKHQPTDPTPTPTLPPNTPKRTELRVVQLPLGLVPDPFPLLGPLLQPAQNLFFGVCVCVCKTHQ